MSRAKRHRKMKTRHRRLKEARYALEVIYLGRDRDKWPSLTISPSVLAFKRELNKTKKRNWIGD